MSKKELGIILLIFSIFILLLFVPMLKKYVENPDTAYFNVYHDEKGQPLMKYHGDEATLYAPYLKEVRKGNFGDPLIKEYSGTWIGINPGIAILPFALLTTWLGIDAGVVIGIIFFNLLFLLLLYILLKKIITKKWQACIMTFVLYFTTTLLQPNKIIALLRNMSWETVWLLITEETRLMRFPSLSFTLLYLLFSLFLLLSLDKQKGWKKRTCFFLIALNGIIYPYNFMILSVVVGLFFVKEAWNKNKKAVSTYFFLECNLVLAFAIMWLAKQSMQYDSLIGTVKYGIVSTHLITKYTLVGLSLFLVSTFLYSWYCKKKIKEEIKKTTTLWYFCCIAIAIQMSINVITGFQIQVDLFLNYLPLFFLLLLSYIFFTTCSLEKYKIFWIVLGILVMVILGVKIQANIELQPLETGITGVIDFMNQEGIEEKRIMALHPEAFYLLPIYTNNYLTMGNTFSTYVNVTQNMERLAQMYSLYNQTFDEQFWFEHDIGHTHLFHLAYTYLPYYPPCETCMFDGKKKTLTWFDYGFRKIPDDKKKEYLSFFKQSFTWDEYEADYLLIDKEQDGTPRQYERFIPVYENERYLLLAFPE